MSVIKIQHRATLFHGSKVARDLVISKIAQGNQAGISYYDEPVVHGSFSNTAGITIASKALVYDTRILLTYYLPTIGGSKGEVKASEAFTRMWNALAGTAYTTTSFGRADVQKHCIISEGFITLLDRIDRYLDTLALVEYSNKGAQYLVNCQFANGTGKAYADLVAQRNLLVPYLNKLIVPANVPAISRHRAFCRNIYTDDVHDKTQLILMVPIVHYTGLNSSFDVIHENLNRTLNIDYVIDYLYNALRSYIDSSFYEDLAPYLYRAMLDPNGPKIAKAYDFLPYQATLMPKLEIEAYYDIEFLQLLRNADFVGDLFNNYSSASTDNLNIVEDSDGVCRQGVLSLGGNSVNGIYPRPFMIFNYPSGNTYNVDSISVNGVSSNIMNTAYGWGQHHRLLNMEDFPTPEDAMYVAMNGLAYSDVVQSKLRKISHCGDALFLKLVYVGVAGYSASNLLTFTEMYPVALHNIKLVSGNTYSVSTKIIDFTLTNTIGKFNQATQKMLSIQGFRCGPTIQHVFADNDDGDFAIASNYLDVDNLVIVTDVAIRQFALFNTFDMFNMTNSNGTDNSKSDGRQHRPTNDRDRRNKSESSKDSGESATKK